MLPVAPGLRVWRAPSRTRQPHASIRGAPSAAARLASRASRRLGARPVQHAVAARRALRRPPRARRLLQPLRLQCFLHGFGVFLPICGSVPRLDSAPSVVFLAARRQKSQARWATLELLAERRSASRCFRHPLAAALKPKPRSAATAAACAASRRGPKANTKVNGRSSPSSRLSRSSNVPRSGRRPARGLPSRRRPPVRPSARASV